MKSKEGFETDEKIYSIEILFFLVYNRIKRKCKEIKMSDKKLKKQSSPLTNPLSRYGDTPKGKKMVKTMNDSKYDNENDPGNDSEIAGMMREIRELLHDPGVKKRFSEVLRQAKQELKKPGEKKEDKIPDSQDTVQRSKSYFFELNKIKEPGFDLSSRWELGSLKLKAGKKIVEEIFSQLRKKIDDCEVAPNKIQSEIVKLPAQDTLFQINFTKSSEKKVSGFIKEIGKDRKAIGEDTDGFVVKNNINMLKLATKAKNLDKDDMYARIKQAMKKNPDVIEDIFFYLLMTQKIKLK